MASIQAWAQAARPKTLPAGASPVLLGASLAYYLSKDHFNYLIFFLTLICTLLLQITSNLVNDYYDGIRGIDDEDRLGPKRVTALGLIEPHILRNAFISTSTLAFLIGVFLIFKGGLPILILGLLSLAGAFLYTAGPYPLSYYALGEVLAFIYFGLIAVWGSFYLLNGEHDQSALILGIFPGLISATILGINNLRDTDSDIKTGKTTLSTLLGKERMRKLLLTLIALSQLPIIYLARENKLLLLGLLPLFMYRPTIASISSEPISPIFNQYLAKTGIYLFLCSLIISGTYVFQA